MKKLLVTGCAGFIGAHFVEYLLENYPQDFVVGVDCLTYAANEKALAGLCRSARFRFYKADICDKKAMDEIFCGEMPDVVVNFAAESHVDRSIENADAFIRTNVVGTQVLLDASVRYGVKRFHQISTDEVYGDLPFDSDERFTESSDLNPSSPYSASKAAADLLVMSYNRTHGLKASVSRSTNNYGIYQHEEKFIPLAVKKLVRGEPIPLHGDGRIVRDWLYVVDHCSAVDLIIRAGKCEIYNISAYNPQENIRLAELITELSGLDGKGFEFVAMRKGQDVRYSVDCEKIRSLGWTPKADFRQALGKSIKWYIIKETK